MAERGGEGRIRAFAAAASALEAAADSEGYVLEYPGMALCIHGPTGVPAGFEVPGAPMRVWLLVTGDRGCTSGVLGAFALEAAAREEAAAIMAADDEDGLSVFVVQAAVEK